MHLDKYLRHKWKVRSNGISDDILMGNNYSTFLEYTYNGICTYVCMHSVYTCFI